MDKNKELPKCPECKGALSADVARGWCKGEWSDYYCHHCQRDFFEHQVTDDEWSEQAVQLDLKSKSPLSNYLDSLKCNF